MPSNSCPNAIRFSVAPKFTGVSPGFYSFIGPVAYYTLRKRDYGCCYYCDGMLSARMFAWALGHPITRTSFDYGSIAELFFQECAQRRLRVLVVGGKPTEAESFGRHLSERYPTLKQECIDGYPAGGFNNHTVDGLMSRLVADAVDVVLIALGSPLQEQVGQQLMARGFQGTIITAGAFITQTVIAGQQGTYYPRWINSLNLRFLWRLIHEPHTRSRFKYVLGFPFSFAVDRLRGRVHVHLSKS